MKVIVGIQINGYQFVFFDFRNFGGFLQFWVWFYDKDELVIWGGSDIDNYMKFVFCLFWGGFFKLCFLESCGFEIVFWEFVFKLNDVC